MRRLTDGDLAKIIGSTIKGYHIEAARVKRGPFVDTDHYGIILGKNTKGDYVTWEFHLLDDEAVSVYWGHYLSDREAAIRDFNTRDMPPTSRKFDESELLGGEISAVATRLLKTCIDDYASRVWNAIADEVTHDVRLCTCDCKDGFTDGDVALAIGRAIAKRFGYEA